MKTERIAALQSSELLIGLSSEELAHLSTIASETRVPAGKAILTCGTEASAVSLVASGEVELDFPVFHGGTRRDVRFQTVGVGHALGWSALVPPHRLTLSARALVETTLITFPRAALLTLLARQPELELTLMRNLTRILAHRLQEAHGLWLMELLRVPTEPRPASVETTVGT